MIANKNATIEQVVDIMVKDMIETTNKTFADPETEHKVLPTIVFVASYTAKNATIQMIPEAKHPRLYLESIIETFEKEAEAKADIIITMNEAWVSKQKPGEDFVPASQADNRQERFIFFIELKDRVRLVQYDCIRSDDGQDVVIDYKKPISDTAFIRKDDKENTLQNNKFGFMLD